MATATKPCIAQLSSFALRARIPPPSTTCLPFQQIRSYALGEKNKSPMNPMKSRPKGEDQEKMKMKKKKKIKALGGFKSQDMSKADKYSLCDAMR